MENKEYVLETQKDDRDYDVSRFIPYKEDIKDVEFMLDLPNMDIILKQYHGSCVGHAFALAKSICEYQHTHKWIDYDPYVIYGTRYEDQHDGVGMQLRWGANVLYKEGAFLRRDFGEVEEMPELKKLVDNFKKNNPDLVEQAKNSRIEGYAFPATTYFTPIKTALKAGMPVVASIDAWNGMGGVDGIIKRTNKPKKYERHAVCIIGWRIIEDETYWIIANSWGKHKGYRGLLFFDAKRKIHSAISISDTITPIKKKCERIEFIIGSYEFTADGEVKEFDTAPYIKEGRTYLPVRFVAENLGASVEWNAGNGVATIRSEEAVIVISDRSNIISINGKCTKMDVCPEISNGRMMCPIRYISEALNCDVQWDAKNKKVCILAL